MNLLTSNTKLRFLLSLLILSPGLLVGPLVAQTAPKPPLTPAVLTTGATPGSIFVPVGAPLGRLVDATRDFRASQVDDLITIVISESASAVSSGVTNTTRKSAAKNGITGLGGTIAASGLLGGLTDLVNLSNNQQIQGTGQTSRNTTVTTTLSARVVGVTRNGTLLIEGSKEVAVNAERQSVMVRGLVRPEDLTTGNTILSTRIADLRVEVNGKGVVADAVRRPNKLYRLLLGLLPF